MKSIFVDADACPVKDEIIRVAIRNNTMLIWFAMEVSVHIKMI